MGFILGLDISTSTVGAAVIDSETDEIKSLFYVSLKKEKGLLNKIKLLKTELQKQNLTIDMLPSKNRLLCSKRDSAGLKFFHFFHNLMVCHNF